MPDDIEQKPNTPAAPEAPAADELKNLKAEMNRKLSNLESTNAALLEQMKAFAKPAAPAAPESGKKVSVFDDEDQFAESVVAAADARISKRMADQAASQAKANAVIGKLMNEFPELGDASNPLTVKANEIFAALPEEDKSHRLALDAAVKQAALEMGIKPKSKRSDDENDAFSLGGSRGAGKSRRETDEVDARTLEFAKLMGADVDKVKAIAKKRKQYSRFE
jgi:hypothetical protein